MAALSILADTLRYALACFSDAAGGGELNWDAGLSQGLSDIAEQAMDSWALADPTAKAEVTRLLVELGSTLGTLDETLTTALAAQRSKEAQPGNADPRMQFLTALPVLRECCALACAVQLSAEQAAEFARCGALIVGDSSRHALASWLKSAGDTLRRAAEPAPMRDGGHRGRGLVAAAMAAEEAAAKADPEPNLLEAADLLLQLLLSHEGSSGKLEGFAASVWTTERVTRWLAALLVVMDGVRQKGVTASLSRSFALVCGTLLTHPAFKAHQAAIQASPALQAKLAALAPRALNLALNSLEAAFEAFEDAASGSSEAGSSNGSATGSPAGGAADAGEGLQVALSCLQLVIVPSLNSGVQRLAAAAAAAQQQLLLLKAWLAESTALLQVFAAGRPSSLPAQAYTQLLLHTIAAAAHPCSLLSTAEEAEDLGPPTAAPIDWEVTEKVWGKLAADMLPHLARALAHVQHDSELAEHLAERPLLVGAVCGKVAAVAGTATDGVGVMKSLAAQAAGDTQSSFEPSMQLFATAADVGVAALQLLHFAAELPGKVNFAAEPTVLAPAAARLADICLGSAYSSALAAFQQRELLVSAKKPAARKLRAALQQSQVPAQLSQLHTTARRLAHYAAAASVQQVAAVPALSNWHMFTCGGLIFRTITDLALGPAEGAFDSRELQGIAAAEVEAQLVSLELLRPSKDGAGGSRFAGLPAADKSEHIGAAVECLVQAYGLQGVPFGSDAAARKALVDTLRSQVQSLRQTPDASADNCSFTLRHGGYYFQLGAVLVASGLLGEVLKAAQARQTTAGRETRRLVANLPMLAVVVLEGLRMGVEKLAQASHPSPAAQQAVQQCVAAAADLDAALQGLKPNLLANLVSRYPTQLEPAAKALVAALEAYWELPEVWKERLLALAQAAATRSCAYLRCPNVGAIGGTSAGTQLGSARCSECRAVWYCGTACSHADWRAGHRRTCKALAAARQLEKAKKAAAATEQQQQG